MNDTNIPKLDLSPPANPEIVNLLEAALVRARSGKVAGVAIVEAFGHDALSMGSAGGCPSTLSTGLVKLAQLIADNLFKRPSAIMMPPGRRN